MRFSRKRIFEEEGATFQLIWKPSHNYERTIIQCTMYITYNVQMTIHFRINWINGNNLCTNSEWMSTSYFNLGALSFAWWPDHWKHEGHFSVSHLIWGAAFSIPSKGSMTKENYPVLFTLYLVGQSDSCRGEAKIKNWKFCLNCTTKLIVMDAGIRRDGHLLFEVEMYLQKGCIMVSGVGSS